MTLVGADLGDVRRADTIFAKVGGKELFPDYAIVSASSDSR